MWLLMDRRRDRRGRVKEEGLDSGAGGWTMEGGWEGRVED